MHEELTALLGSRRLATLVRQPAADGDPDGRPAGLGQDDRVRQARPPARQAGKRSLAWSPATSTARRPSSSCRALGRQLDVPVLRPRHRRRPGRDRAAGVEQARAQGRDVVIVDTAGRLHIDEELMDELVAASSDADAPHQVLLVVDAMTGQDAVNVGQAFAERVDFDGVILTKLDGDARGGAALSVRAVTGKPIKFVGVGEKLDALEAFHPDRHGEPHPRHGRRRRPHRAGARSRSTEQDAQAMEDEAPQGRVHARRLPRAAAPGAQDGPARGHRSGCCPASGCAQGQEPADRRARARPRRGDHPVDDAQPSGGSPSSSTAAAAARIAAGSGTTVQEVNQLLRAVHADAEDDEADGERQDAPVSGAHAMTRPRRGRADFTVTRASRTLGGEARSRPPGQS